VRQRGHGIDTAEGDVLMKSLLILAVVIANVSGCVNARDQLQPDANASVTHAEMPSFLASSPGHEAMMKMIHRRPKNGNFGAIGS
jgi:hypothetical protein